MRVFLLLFVVFLYAATPASARCLAGNCMNGNGRAQFPNGDTYSGEWSQSLMDGNGTYTYKSGAKYTGSFSKGKIDGYGVVLYPDGARFEGNWKANRKHGTGKLFRPSGKTEVGRWTNGKRTSNSQANVAAATAQKKFRDCNALYCDEVLGRYTYRDGTVYEGAFEDGDPAGDGEVRYANGDIYTGSWFANAPDGRGMYQFANGKKVNGQWEDGKLIRQDYAATQPAKSQLAASTAITNTTPTGGDGIVNMYAVVVGIGDYDAMQSLNYTDDDAYQMYAFLKSPEGGALSDDQIEVLVDEHATKSNIVSALAQKFGAADADDIVVFYYSGHGVDGYFVPYDFDGYDNLLSHQRVKQILEGSAAKHKLVLADACHSGSLLASRSRLASTTKLYDAFTSSTGGTALLLSSHSSEVSLEANNLRSGVFSHYLMRGLKGEADTNGNSIVTVTELHKYLYGRVRDYTNRRQSPVLSGNFDVSMPVATVRN